MRPNGVVWVKAAAGVLIAATAGFGGYNLLSTGCVLGSCSTDEADANVVTVADTSTESSCSTGKTCPLTGAAMETVAFESTDSGCCAGEEKPADAGCCAGEAMAAVQSVSETAATDCKAAGETTGRPACACSSTDECPRDADKAQEVVMTQVSAETTAEACTEEKKAECSEGKVCPITGKVLEVAGGE